MRLWYIFAPHMWVRSEAWDLTVRDYSFFLGIAIARMHVNKSNMRRYRNLRMRCMYGVKGIPISPIRIGQPVNPKTDEIGRAASISSKTFSGIALLHLGINFGSITSITISDDSIPSSPLPFSIILSFSFRLSSPELRRHGVLTGVQMGHRAQRMATEPQLSAFSGHGA
jgi:hypothetical protein